VAYVAAACFLMAAVSFLNGFVTEYRQSRRVGPYAIVPTLPWAVAAALFVLLGLVALLRQGVPWWCLPLAFVGSLVVFGRAIMWAGSSSSSAAEQRHAEPGAAPDGDS
jgi:hypothetical protein